MFYLNGKEDCEPTELKIKDSPDDKLYLNDYIKLVEPVRINKEQLIECSQSSQNKKAKAGVDVMKTIPKVKKVKNVWNQSACKKGTPRPNVEAKK